ncbi:MAG TPA: ABC transporter permease [Terriglobales bacterium]|jgi:putative ABC transport system permease protein|nr:ABC transporter permease [Terriglobales bacterium]
MEKLIQDVRYGLRMLRKSPGFTVVAIVTLALGIGANTAMFSVISAVLLHRLPFPEPERLVRGFGKFPLNDRAAVSPPDFADFRAENRSLTQLAAMAIEDSTSNLTGGARAEQVRSNIVSWNFFDALGVPLKFGRSFQPADEQVSQPQVAILGYGIWRREFGGDPAVVGRTLNLDGRPLNIVGILPSDIPLLSEAQLWLPMPMLAQGMSHRGGHFLAVVGRLKPGFSRGQAQSDVDAIARSLARQYPESNTAWSLNLFDLRDVIVGPVRPVLLLLVGAVGLLLLIACANVANLLLARVTGRRKEIAVRAALGASRGRIVRQIITETTLLALAGGVLAALLSVWGVSLLRAVAPADLPRLEEIRVNPGVLLFTGVISILTGILFGAAPALQLSAAKVADSLKLGGRSSGTATRHKLGRALMVGEIAVSFALLVGAGLVVKSVWRLIHVDPGFRSDHVATARISLSDATYKEDAQRAIFFRQLEERIAGLPGVEHAGAISELPLDGQLNDSFFRIQGRVYGPNENEDANFRHATPGYLKPMGIPLLAGRWFDERDGLNSPGIVVVNQPFADRYFRGKNPIGESLVIEGSSKTIQIVGVIGGVNHFALNVPQPPEMYVPEAQAPSDAMNLVVRAASDPQALASAMREAVSSLDRGETLSAVRSLDDVVQGSIAQPRFSAQLLGLFAVLALLLAAVGLYGLIAYSVSQRTQEIGIRLSLGAQRRDVLRLVLGEGISLALAGSVIGLMAALGLTRLLASLLYTVTPTDPVTFAAVGVSLIGVALFACYIPARRATKVDPMVALRNE